MVAMLIIILIKWIGDSYFDLDKLAMPPGPSYKTLNMPKIYEATKSPKVISLGGASEEIRS